VILVAALLALPAPAGAYTRSTTSSTDPAAIAWDLDNDGTALPNVTGGQVGFCLHGDGSGDIFDGSDLAALEQAFRTWSGVTGAALQFVREPDTTNTSTLDDGEFPIFWTEFGTVVDQGTPSTDDDVDVAGALAVTFVYRTTWGDETGEIIDANIVFNGADFSWTTDPAAYPGRYDVEAVGLHEIGHALGLDHSPVAAASLFPRIGSGRTMPRTLSDDDVAGIIAAYPGGNSAANRGGVTGTLRAENEVFGGMVWILDAAGRVAAHAMSDKDGSYLLAGLRPGEYTLHAQPPNEPSGFYLFSENNLGPYYRDLDRSFLSLPGVPVTVEGGSVTVQDLLAEPGLPSMEIKLIGRGGTFSNIATQLRRGESGVVIGVAGPGLPAAGAPLSVSGQGVTIHSTFFGTAGGFPAVEAMVSVAADAALGLRDIVIAGPGERTVALGGVEILFPPSTGLPEPVAGLRAGLVGPSVDLTWPPVPGAEWYRVYRGSLHGLAGGYDYDVAPAGCSISVTDASLLTDAGDGGSYYYLVTGLGRAGEGEAGVDGEGLPRPSGQVSCP